MTGFQPGGLVKPNMGHSSYDSEENPAAIGLIIEIRRRTRRVDTFEARILWNDIPDNPVWMNVEEVLLLE